MGGRTSRALTGKSGTLRCHGRWYTGAPSLTATIGTCATSRPSKRSTIVPVSITCPIATQSRPHFSKIARAVFSAPRRSTRSIRSWLSESMIS